MGVSDKKYDLLVFGEPMVQYTVKDRNVSAQVLQNPSVGGESVFVAVTAAKLGLSVAYYAAIAKDPYENLIRETLARYNINTDFCVSCDNAFNGIEIICDADNSKREFFYNRPPGFFKNPIPPKANIDLLKQCRMIYASSDFTLSSPEARSLVFESFYYANHNETLVAFDPNLRLHRHSATYLRETIWTLMPFIDFFSASAASGEMQVLFGSNDIKPADRENIRRMKREDKKSNEEIKADYRYDNMRDCALNLLRKDVRYAAMRNGGDDMVFAYVDYVKHIECNECKGNENVKKRKEIMLKEYKPVRVPVEKVGNGYFAYSGAIFNGAFIASILQETNPEEAAKYAANCATQKCRISNTLSALFPR